jgi:indole-3-glycerol phosphate synthase
VSFVPPKGVLGELCDKARERTAEARRRPLPPPAHERPPFAMRAALARRDRFPLVCEVKRASPSAGRLRPDLSVTDQARLYASAGAAGVSVLTEPTRFEGTLDDLLRVRDAVDVPLLRKDFTVDPFMVDEAHAYGADAVLLIAAAIPEETLLACADRAHALGLDVLLELIYPRDLGVVSLRDWPLVGVNARDLETLDMDLGRFRELSQGLAREGRTLVAESGLHGASAIRAVRRDGAQAALIGEALLKSERPDLLIAEWSSL